MIIGSNLISNISELLKKNSIKFQKILIVIDNKVPNKFINIIKKSLGKKKSNFFFINANEPIELQNTKFKLLIE